MSTNGNFNPPSSPPCDETLMTRAAVIALRDAGQLRVGCHYRWAGPVIGTAGNTSPTEILSHAVRPDDLARAASVHTTFDNVAFDALVNIDGGTAGDINSMTDHWNNTVSDEDANAPTVHAQFPWHASGPNLRDNRVNDCTITGWAGAVAAGVVIWDNDLLESGVDLAGQTSGSFLRNRLTGTSVTVSSPNVQFSSNSLLNSFVTFSGAGAGPQQFQSNEVARGIFEVTPATTGAVTAQRNVIGGAGSVGYRVRVDGATGTVTASGNRLTSQGSDTVSDLVIDGADVTFNSNEVTAGTVSIDAPATVSVRGCTLTEPALTITAGTSIEALRVSAGTTTVAAPTGSIVQNVDAIDSTLNVTGPGTVAAGSLLGSSLANAGFTVQRFEMLGGTKTASANQTDKSFGPAFDNWT